MHLRLLTLAIAALFAACSSSNGAQPTATTDTGIGLASETAATGSTPETSTTGSGTGDDTATTTGDGTGGTGDGTGSTTGAIDNGFRPNKDGFGFQNYTNEAKPTNLTAEDVRSIFGDGVCASLAGGACTLTPAASQWATTSSNDMNGGHCFGMAHLASAVFMGKVTVDKLGGAATDTTNSLKLENNTALQRAIGTAFVMQGLTPAINTAKMAMTPGDLVTFLSTELKTKTETYTIAIFQTDATGNKSGGHAVTPYAIKEDAGKTQIMVWDNNFPNEERSIEVDLTAKTWKYSAAANPNDPASLYVGDDKTLSIGVYPVTPTLGVQECPFCKNVGAPGDVTVVANGAGNLQLADGTGNTVDETQNSFPGAVVTERTSADLFKDDPEPIYRVPGTTDLTITIDGTKLTAASPTNVKAFGPGWVLGVEDINLAPGEKDTLVIGKGGDTLTYTTASMETPGIVFGIQTAGADYEFTFQVVGDANGITVTLDIDLVTGKLSLRIQNEGATVYGIVMRRIDDKGESEFSHANGSEAGGDTVIFDFDDWAGQGTPLSIEVDKGSDGSVDTTETATDDK